jgi:hypothetical protein
MKPLLTSLAAFLACISSAMADPGSRLLQDVLQGTGEIEFLKEESLSAHLSDGTPEALVLVFYDASQRALGNDPERKVPPAGKLSCMVYYSTSTISDIGQVTPGIDLTIPAGTRASWVIDDIQPPRYRSYVNSNGYQEQQVSLRFHRGNGIMSMDCVQAALPENSSPLTVADFEKAFRGLLTLR